MKNRSGAFLDDALVRLGLNVRERCDMITYWLLQLEAYPFNVIYFVDVQRYAQVAKLDITPVPDVIIRVFMVFRYAKLAILLCCDCLYSTVSTG